MATKIKSVFKKTALLHDVLKCQCQFYNDPNSKLWKKKSPQPPLHTPFWLFLLYHGLSCGNAEHLAIITTKDFCVVVARHCNSTGHGTSDSFICIVAEGALKWENIRKRALFSQLYITVTEWHVLTSVASPAILKPLSTGFTSYMKHIS